MTMIKFNSLRVLFVVGLATLTSNDVLGSETVLRKVSRDFETKIEAKLEALMRDIAKDSLLVDHEDRENWGFHCDRCKNDRDCWGRCDERGFCTCPPLWVCPAVICEGKEEGSFCDRCSYHGDCKGRCDERGFCTCPPGESCIAVECPELL